MWRICLAILPLLLACPAKSPPTPPETTADRMLTHFAYGTEAHDAVIGGDLDRAKKAGVALAAMAPLPDTPESSLPFLAAVRVHAGALAEAPTLAEAARAVARLGQACGDCHAAVGRGPRAPKDEYGNPYAVPTDVMPRHQWAMLWVWYGVVSADAGAYDAGLAVLAEAPTWDPRSENSTFAGLQKRVQELAVAADRTPESRAALYGEVLATCTACHQRYRKTP